MGLLGCSVGQRPVAVIEPSAGPMFGSLGLGAGVDDALEPRFFVPVSDTQVVALDRLSQELWLFDLGVTSSFRVLTRLRLPSRETVAALTVAEGKVVALDTRGVLRTIDPVSGRVVDSGAVRARRDTRVVGLQQSTATRPLLLEEKASRSGPTGTFFDSLILTEIGSDRTSRPVWAAEKVGARPMSALLADYSSVTVRGDTLWIGGASPPRVQRIVRSRVSAEVGAAVALEGSPVRRLSSGERAALRHDVSHAHLDSSIGASFDVYPSVARAWPLSDGYIVLAGTGGSTFALDRYCGNRFEETTLQGPDIVEVSWLPHVVVVQRRAPSGAGGRLDLYSPAQLAPRCGLHP